MVSTTDVSTLLQQWNLSEDAVNIIIDKGYTNIELLRSLVPSIENFELLNFPKMPDRTMYTLKWTQWMKKAEELNPLTPPTPATRNNSASDVDLFTSPPNERRAQSHPETPAHESALSVSAPGDCNPLRNLLEKSSATRQLLTIGLQREFRRSEQSELCDIILDHLLKDTSEQKPKLAYSDFIQWAKHVHDLFTREPEAIWFSVTPPLKQELAQLSPGATAPPSASARPHGKLYDRYGKRQAIWRENRGLVNNKTVKTGQISDELDEIGTERRGRKRKQSQPPLRDENLDHNHNLEEELKINGDIITIAKYQGLESSLILETAWKATWSLRKRYLMTVSAAQYLKKFPLLCLTSVGPHLINIDFTNLNSNISPSALYTGLRQNSDLIENRAFSKLRTLSKPLRAQQQRIHDLPKDTELQKLTAVLLLLPFAIVGGKTGVRTKASRFDAAIRFIYVTKTRSEGEAYLKELRKAASDNSAPSSIGVQPLVIAVGEDLANINSAFVVIDDVWLCCPNILEAVDLCFKTFYVFNLRYPIECEHIWQVLQFTCYGIRDEKYDKYIIDVNRFLNESKHPGLQETGNTSSQETANSTSQEIRENPSQETSEIFIFSQETANSTSQEIRENPSQETSEIPSSQETGDSSSRETETFSLTEYD